MNRTTIVASLLAFALAACSSGGGTGGVPGTSPAGQTVSFGDPVGDVECDRGGHDAAYHIHSMLRVTIDGKLYDPEDDIGVDGERCMYWVHVHEGTGGVVHVEAPENVTVTLGDLVAVWRATYPDSVVLAGALAGLDAGALKVDGEPYVGDWRELPLLDERLIEIG